MALPVVPYYRFVNTRARRYHSDNLVSDTIFLIPPVTDGVTESMPDDQIEAVVRAAHGPEAAVRELASRARARGSQDDITAIVVELEEW